MNITEATAKELITALNRNSKALEAGTKPAKPLWVKVGELSRHTIWDDGQDYEKARNLGWIEYRIVNGCLEYNLNSVPMQFRKAPMN